MRIFPSDSGTGDIAIHLPWHRQLGFHSKLMATESAHLSRMSVRAVAPLLFRTEDAPPAPTMGEQKIYAHRCLSDCTRMSAHRYCENHGLRDISFQLDHGVSSITHGGCTRFG